MSLTWTLALMAAAAAAAVFSGWRGGRPPDLKRGPRMAPWRFLMLLSAALFMLLLIHLGALVTGAPPAAYPV